MSPLVSFIRHRHPRLLPRRRVAAQCAVRRDRRQAEPLVRPTVAGVQVQLRAEIPRRCVQAPVGERVVERAVGTRDELLERLAVAVPQLHPTVAGVTRGGSVTVEAFAADAQRAVAGDGQRLVPLVVAVPQLNRGSVRPPVAVEVDAAGVDAEDRAPGGLRRRQAPLLVHGTVAVVDVQPRRSVGLRVEAAFGRRVEQQPAGLDDPLLGGQTVTRPQVRVVDTEAVDGSERVDALAQDADRPVARQRHRLVGVAVAGVQHEPGAVGGVGPFDVEAALVAVGEQARAHRGTVDPHPDVAERHGAARQQSAVDLLNT
ncbi:hypothetical protein GCM10009558_007730 [Virgisporangium aurantiacum]